ncbi:MAG: hypothetical protein ACREYF_09215 [Gammaproteobacteria bacterium]
MKLKSVLTSLTVAGSLIGLTGQAYAAADQGIDFAIGSFPAVTVNSTSASAPTVLQTVTATCPAKGFLWATATANFDPSPDANEIVTFHSSISKDSTAYDFKTSYDVFLRSVIGEIRLSANPSMRVDTCSAGSRSPTVS